MTRKTARSTSRRAFIRCGLLSGAVIGTAGSAAGARAEPDRSEKETAAQGADTAQGVMRPYQYVPRAGATVVEAALDWRPAALETRQGEYQAHVLAYDHAPSFRSILFTDAARSAVESGRSVTLSRRRGNTDRAPSAAEGRFLPVELRMSADASSADE